MPTPGAIFSGKLPIRRVIDRRCGWLPLALVVAGVVAFRPAPARAHQASMSHSDVRVDDTRTSIDYQIRINANDAAEPLGLDPDAVPTDQQMTAGADRMFDYVLAHITVETDGRRCPITRLGFRLLYQNDRFAELRWRITCPEPFTRLVIDYQLFFDIDPLHTGNLRVVVPGMEPAATPLTAGHGRFVWNDLGQAPPSGLAAFVRSGIEHILHGYDHIAFLLGLLLVVSITRSGTGPWRPRPVVPAIRYTATIVTSFTIAHSLTLIAAAMGWISLPGRFVESTIAISIVYIAVENIIHPEARHRWLLTFGFGLIHGLGFASVLRHLLPPEELVVPLLAFNVGVEIGQLLLVITVVPVLQLLTSRLLGADRYRWWLVPIGSAVVGGLGLLWLIERVLAVEILGF